MSIRSSLGAIGFGLAMVLSQAAQAEPLKIEAVMSPKEKLQLDFKDGSKHFVLMVRREGQATGAGPLAGAVGPADSPPRRLEIISEPITSTPNAIRITFRGFIRCRGQL